MKKFFSLASALMLALGMGMTSCSNDLDEVQAPVEQQAEMHKLYLTATAPNSPQTRAFVESVENSDAIKITGWKDGDKLYGIYMKDPKGSGSLISASVGIVEFTFKSATHEFESEYVPSQITNDQIKYFLHGNNPTINSSSWTVMMGTTTIYASFLLGGFEMVDIENNSTDIPMWGEASVNSEGKLATNMQLVPELALVCVHNESGSAIEVSMDVFGGESTYAVKGSGLSFRNSNGVKFVSQTSGDAALTKSIPAGGKAYLPMQSTTWGYKVKVGDTVIKTIETSSITAGKIYKLVYDGAAPAATTGTAKAIIGGSEVDVPWSQLWENGPKFAEYNVGASSYTDGGITMTFAQATASPFEWGSNWTLPSKDDMDELLKAATSAGSEKVTCTNTEKNGVYGFEFTGSTAGYESNSVFFPAQDGSGDYCNAAYWSGSASGDKGWLMLLYCSSGYWGSMWSELSQNFDFLVRPVLK